MKKWAQQPHRDRLLFVLRLAASVGAVIFAMLQLFGVWDRANSVAMPLMGLSILLQACQEWPQKRSDVVISLCLALFILILSAAITLMELF